MTHINDFWLDHYCIDIAHDIAIDARDYEQAIDWSSESADSSEYVIYTYKAHMICQNCDVTQGKEFVRDCYPDGWLDYDDQASAIAYGEILCRVQNALNKYFEEWTEDKENV